MPSNEYQETFHHESFMEAFQKVEAQVTTDLATCATMLFRLLLAVDLFPLGGLCRGHYAEQAIRRYWLLWMPLLHEQQSSGAASSSLLPPLDVQWAWFVHRLNPVKYLQDCTALFGTAVHPADIQQALGFDSGSSSSSSSPYPKEQEMQQPSQQQQQPGPDGARGGGLTRQVWEARYPSGRGQPAEHAFWPPAPAPPCCLENKRQQEKQPRCSQPHLCQRPNKCCGQHSQRQQQPARKAQATETTAAGGGNDDREGHREQPQPQPDEPPVAAAAAAAATEAGAAAADMPPGSLDSVHSYVSVAMTRQGRFLHQMLRCFYQDPAFLEAGRTRYLRFLALARTQQPGAPLLNPLYDQDVMWHSHMALSGSYEADCAALMPAGRVLGHNDALSAESLVDNFVFTLGRYEKATGLMVNPSPTRRLPTCIAQPLVAQMWPLAAVLADPRVTPLPSPGKLAAELRSGGMQQLQQFQEERPRQQQRSAVAATAPSRSGPFSGDPDAPPGPRGGRPPMLGSPDHLCRSGSFAVYGLWSLAEYLRLGTRVRNLEGSGHEAAGGRRSVPRAGGGARGLGWLGGCLRGGSGAAAAEAAAVAAEGVDPADLDVGVRHMTQQLLRLADLTDPDSPCATHRHTFWDAIAPLPPPRPPPPPSALAQPPDPAVSSCASSDTSAPSGPSSSEPAPPAGMRHPATAGNGAKLAGGAGGRGNSRPRHPAPAPCIDIPADYLPPAERGAEPAYLAPHQYAARGQVYYTPADFRLLGDGRWCLPAPIAAEVAERDAAEAAASAGPVYDDRVDVGDVQDHHALRHQRRRRRRRPWWLAGGRREYDSDDGDGYGGSVPQVHGNALGGIVFSPRWPHRMSDCYLDIYVELQSRAAAAAAAAAAT